MGRSDEAIMVYDHTFKINTYEADYYNISIYSSLSLRSLKNFGKLNEDHPKSVQL